MKGMPATSPSPTIAPTPWSLAIASGVLVAAVLFAFWEFFAVQWHYAINQPADWGHTLFIPLIALYIVGLHRADLVAKPFQRSLGGFLLIFLGLAFYSLTTSKRPDLHRLGGYLFLTNGRATSSDRSVENLAFDLTSTHAYYCKLQIDMTEPVFDDGSEFRAKYQEQASQFISALLPHLMRAMPDWREYEAK